MIKLTIFCLVTLCVSFTYGDIGNMASNLSQCGKLKNDIMSKIESVQADGTQAACAIKKAAEIVMDAIKGTELEKNCADDCKKMMDMMKEDEEKAKAIFTEVKDKLIMKEWQEKMKQKHEEMKGQNPERSKSYEEEGTKCKNCGMKNMQAAEKKCKEMNADELVNSVKSSCSL